MKKRFEVKSYQHVVPGVKPSLPNVPWQLLAVNEALNVIVVAATNGVDVYDLQNVTATGKRNGDKCLCRFAFLDRIPASPFKDDSAATVSGVLSYGVGK